MKKERDWKLNVVRSMLDVHKRQKANVEHSTLNIEHPINISECGRGYDLGLRISDCRRQYFNRVMEQRHFGLFNFRLPILDCERLK